MVCAMAVPSILVAVMAALVVEKGVDGYGVLWRRVPFSPMQLRSGRVEVWVREEEVTSDLRAALPRSTYREADVRVGSKRAMLVNVLLACTWQPSMLQRTYGRQVVCGLVAFNALLPLKVGLCIDYFICVGSLLAHPAKISLGRSIQAQGEAPRPRPSRPSTKIPPCVGHQ